MPHPRWRFVRLAAIVGSLAALAAVAALRNEDVVKMVLERRPVAAIVAAIESSPADYDLSPEMIDELRRAGVPREVLEAMAARVPHAKPAAEPDEVAPGRARLTVRLRSPGTWSAPASASDLAVFLACTTPRHAPSPWRPGTPLGEDFAVPRHEMLAFVAGARRVPPADGEPARLVLEIPSALVADVVPDDPHDFLLGLAVRTGTRWAQVASVSLPGLNVPEGGAELFGGLESPEAGSTFPRLSLRRASTPASTPPPPPS